MKKGAEKLSKFLNAKQQGRLDGFFSVKPRSTKKDEESSKGKGKGAAKGKGTKRKVITDLIFNDMFKANTSFGNVTRVTTKRRVLVKSPRPKSNQLSSFSVGSFDAVIALRLVFCRNLFHTSSVIIL